jgi:hypothetical protein
MTARSSDPGVATHQGVVAATIVGLALQLVMVGVGHAVPSLRPMWGPLGTLISLAVGIWAGWYARGAGPAAVGGAVAGGVGALAGIAVAFGLGDVPLTLLALGTAASTVAGIAGAVVTSLVRHR